MIFDRTEVDVPLVMEANHMLYGQQANGIFFNVPTMPLCYTLNAVGSLINDEPGLVGRMNVAMNKID